MARAKKVKEVEEYKIVLPKIDDNGKSRFSYSQYNKWKTSKKDYFKSYFLGERFDGNAYTEFGTLVGEALENDDYKDFNDKERAVLSQVTRLDQFERRIDFDLGGFTVLGFIDTNDLLMDGIKGDAKEIVDTIVDYKTGALNKVEVYEDDGYDQVTIYAGAIEQETGYLPTKGWVELIERTGNPFKGESLKLGNKVVVIPQDVSKEAVEAVKINLIKVATEISKSYAVFNKLNAITV
tara:strand:+ start:3849 stop:4559 length:711 start_codon:yes stop_codon:yes gene_type:complete